jgi:hypothetical protein
MSLDSVIEELPSKHEALSSKYIIVQKNVQAYIFIPSFFFPFFFFWQYWGLNSGLHAC